MADGGIGEAAAASSAKGAADVAGAAGAAEAGAGLGAAATGTELAGIGSGLGAAAGAAESAVPFAAGVGAAETAGAAGASGGLASLGSSVLPAAEAFGTGGGTIATDAALSAGAGASGTAAADAAMGGAISSGATGLTAGLGDLALAADGTASVPGLGTLETTASAMPGDATALSTDFGGGASSLGTLGSGTYGLDAATSAAGGELGSGTYGITGSEAALGGGEVVPVADMGSSASALDTLQGYADKALKYGPLAMQGLNLMGSKSLAQKYASQLQGIGGTQNAVAQQEIADAQAGKINPADQSAINQWKAQATAQAKQYYAKAGLSNSSMERQAINDIAANAAAQFEKARQNLLAAGMAQLNITDKFQQAAVSAEMSTDQAAAQQLGQFVNAYGQWMRALPATTSGASTTTPGASTPAAGA